MEITMEVTTDMVIPIIMEKMRKNNRHHKNKKLLKSNLNLKHPKINLNLKHLKNHLNLKNHHHQEITKAVIAMKKKKAKPKAVAIRVIIKHQRKVKLLSLRAATIMEDQKAVKVKIEEIVAHLEDQDPQVIAAEKNTAGIPFVEASEKQLVFANIIRIVVNKVMAIQKTNPKGANQNHKNLSVHEAREKVTLIRAVTMEEGILIRVVEVERAMDQIVLMAEDLVIA